MAGLPIIFGRVVGKKDHGVIEHARGRLHQVRKEAHSTKAKLHYLVRARNDASIIRLVHVPPFKSRNLIVQKS